MEAKILNDMKTMINNAAWALAAIIAVQPPGFAETCKEGERVINVNFNVRQYNPAIGGEETIVYPEQARITLCANEGESSQQQNYNNMLLGGCTNLIDVEGDEETPLDDISCPPGNAPVKVRVFLDMIDKSGNRDDRNKYSTNGTVYHCIPVDDAGKPRMPEIYNPLKTCIATDMMNSGYKVPNEDQFLPNYKEPAKAESETNDLDIPGGDGIRAYCLNTGEIYLTNATRPINAQILNIKPPEGIVVSDGKKMTKIDHCMKL